MSATTVSLILVAFWGAVFCREAWRRRRYYVASAVAVLLIAGIACAYTLNESLFMTSHQIKGLAQATATTDAVAAGRTLTGGTGINTIGDLTSDRTISLANQVTAGSCTACNLSYNAQGQVTAATNGSAGAPADAQYLTLALNSTLSAERKINPDSTLSVTDHGANDNYDVGVNQTYNFTWSGLHTWNPATSQSRAIYFDMNAIGGSINAGRDSHLMQLRSQSHSTETGDYHSDWEFYAQADYPSNDMFVLKNAHDGGSFTTRMTVDYLGDLTVATLTPTNSLGYAYGGTTGTSRTTGFNSLAPASPAKGTVLVNDGTNWVNIGVGSNGQALVADSAQTDGIKWGTVGGSSGGAAPTWEENWRNWCYTKAGFTANSFQCEYYTFATGTSGFTTCGTSSPSALANGGSILEFSGSGSFHKCFMNTAGAILTGSSTKWCFVAHAKTTAGNDSDDQVEMGFYAGGSDVLGVGVIGSQSTSVYKARLTNGTTTNYLTSTVSISTSAYKDFALIQDGTNTCLSVNNEALTGAACTASSNNPISNALRTFTHVNSTGGGTTTLDVDTILACYPSL